MTHVGARHLRREDARFLAGGATYVDDVQLPGLTHAAFVRSPLAHARIRSIDVEEARNHPGVVAVLTGADLSWVRPLVTDLGIPEAHVTTRSPLPNDKVRFVGEAVAIVVADSRYVAEDAAELVVVEWDELPAISSVEKALARDAPLIDETLSANEVAVLTFETDGVDRAFAQAAHVFAKRFVAGRVSGLPVETRGVVSQWDRASRRLTVWSATQVPFGLRAALQGSLDLPGGHVRVISPDVGGGFGVKGHIAMEEIVVAAASITISLPVKWIEDRYEHLAANSHSKEMVVDLELAVSADGDFLSVSGRYFGDGGGYSVFPYSALIDPLAAARGIVSMYTIRQARFEAHAVLTNKCPTGSYRGVGRTTGQSALETLIDDAARALELDPVKLRLQNAIPTTAPYTSATGMHYDGGSYLESIVRAPKLADYDGFRERQAELRSQRRYIGIGFSPFVEQTAWGSAMARATGLRFEYFDSAQITVEATGSITVRTGFHSQGQGHETLFAQLVADELGVAPENVEVVQGDTDSAVFGMGTFASRSAVIGAGTLFLAAEDVRAKLVEIAGALMEVAVDDLEFANGAVTVRGVPQRSMSLAEVAHAAYFRRSELPAELEPAPIALRTYDPPETYGNGTIVAVAEVDVDTGLVQLRHIVAVEDCGTILNPMLLDGQVLGGIAQGIGVALLEDVIYDEDAQLLSGTLMDYLVPTANDVPPVTIEHIETPSPYTLGGIKGAGEAGTQAAPAAILNAVADALAPFDVRVTSCPLDPPTVLGLIEEAKSRDSAHVPATP